MELSLYAECFAEHTKNILWLDAYSVTVNTVKWENFPNYN